MQPIALALLVFAGTQAPTPKAAAHYAWWFATVWLSTTFWWLYVAMHTYGGLPSLLAAIAVVALAGALAAYYAGAVWAWRRWALGTHWGAIVGFAALWLMAEMARGTWLTGFGWGAIGYAHIDGPLAFFLPWIGSYGVSALAAAWAASLAVAVARRQITPVVWVSVLLLAPTLLPAGANQWTTPTGTLQVTLLQGNIPQDEKFETGSGVPLALQWYRDALLQAEGRFGRRTRNRYSTFAPTAPRGLLGPLKQQVRDLGASSTSRHTARELSGGLHQLGGRSRRRSNRLAIRQTPFGPFRRVHSAAVQVVYPADEYSAR